MSERHTRLREEIESHYYRLWQFLGGYLHEDWPIHHGTPEKAVDAAIAEHPTEIRQQVRRELAALLAKVTDDSRLRVVLNDGLGINMYFKAPRDARAFADEVERKLLASIKNHFEQERKPMTEAQQPQS